MRLTRRRFYSNCVYEICFRARRGIPLPARRVVRLLIRSAIARTQRDDKVTICHEIWNGSHCHLIVICKDAELFARFYMELKKKLTDGLKRLLGERWMNVWERRATVMRIHDLEMAKNRIAYLYANPAQDNLEETIERFPNYSTWKDYRRCTDRLDQMTSVKVPWVRLPSIPNVGPNLTRSQDWGLEKLLTKRNRKHSHELRRFPNAWMKCFGVTTDEGVRRANEDILEKLREREAKARELRAAAGKRVFGAARLMRQPIMAPHTPKKHERKLFILATNKEDRIAEIESFRFFCQQCDECYGEWRRGNLSIGWPEGAFKPTLPPNYNILGPPRDDPWQALAA